MPQLPHGGDQPRDEYSDCERPLVVTPRVNAISRELRDDGDVRDTSLFGLCRRHANGRGRLAIRATVVITAALLVLAMCGGGLWGVSVGAEYEQKWSAEQPINAAYWQSDAGSSMQGYPWPEQDATAFDLVSRTKNVGIAISGGGCRSYAAGFGQLRALEHLGFLRQARYLIGVSGGAWLVGVYTYHQTGKGDDVLLGQVPEPGTLDLTELRKMPTSSLAWGATSDLLFHLVGRLTRGVLCRQLKFPAWMCGKDASRGWAASIGHALLQNYGMNGGQFFTLNPTTRDQIIASNPSLTKFDFIMPARADSPYMVLAASGVGPVNDACLTLPPEAADVTQCLKATKKRFQRVESTPLYCGFPHNRNYSVEYADGKTYPVRVGGLLETFAYGTPAPPSDLPLSTPGSRVTTLMAAPEQKWTIAQAVGSSSSWGSKDLYFYEYSGPESRSGPQKSVVTGNPIIDKLSQPHGMYVGYELLSPEVKSWNTGETRPKTQTYRLADGSIQGDDSGIADLIARGVDHAIAFFNTNHKLCSLGEWNPATMQQPAQMKGCIDLHIPALFGIGKGDWPDTYGQGEMDPAMIQVFESSDFVPFVQLLQANADSGKTGFARRYLTTVNNDYLGIVGGKTVDVAMFYLSPSNKFVASLPSRTQISISQGSGGHFKGFPYFDKTMDDALVTFDFSYINPTITWPPENPLRGGASSITARQTNLLASLTSWAVLEHREEIRDMFQLFQ